MQCICHSAALVASKATEKLSRSPEDLMRSEIHKFTFSVYKLKYLDNLMYLKLLFSGSAKRTTILQDIQRYFVEQKKK